MPRATLSQFLTALATDADLYAEFLRDPAQLVGFYLSAVDSNALFSGDDTSIFQSLCSTPQPMPQPHSTLAPATSIHSGSTEAAMISSAILDSTFNLFGQ